MNTAQKLLAHISKTDAVTGRELADLLGITRQAVNLHLKKLVRGGLVVKEGVTRGATYRRVRGKAAPDPSVRFRRVCRLKGLEEDRAFEDIVNRTRLGRRVARGVLEMVRYAFTEMLNNAVDHSGSGRAVVELEVDAYRCAFRIRDFGIGVFRSITDKFRLKDEYAAVGELLKGKTTTMKERHSGEGIFFVSKVADDFSLRSHGIVLRFDARKRDVFVEQRPFLRGTEVRFAVSRQSRRRVQSVFQEFAPEQYDYRFEKTRVFVRLYPQDYVSRSEARRMLSGLDRFREVELDFVGVKTLAQGFADEVFRVFPAAHPGVRLSAVNVPETLRPMIRHVLDNTAATNLTIA